MKPRVLTDFEGRWTLSREIWHDDGTQAQFTGAATWQPDEKGLMYSEIGCLVVPGQQAMSAERKYLWQDGLRVYFDDGRFFHQVPEAGGEASHWCDPDRYDVSYDFRKWPQWSCLWHVKGPRKSYRLHSHYSQH